MQAASVMQLNTGLERRCLVTRGITALRHTGRKGNKNVLQDGKRREEHVLNLTSKVLTNRESTVHIEGMNGPFGF